MSAVLLSRFANCIFWVARYVERAENLARILAVNDSYARDASGAHNWTIILQLNGDVERFHQTYPAVTGPRVLHFYTLDADNSTSILSSIRGARENARTVRPLISTEMWAQLNIMHNRMREAQPDELGPAHFSRFCDMVKIGCQTFAGITEGTFHRDQGWLFYMLGQCLERADMTTRMIDVKLAGQPGAAQPVGSAVDVSQWNTLLRSAAAYHAFRRVRQRGVSGDAVAEFLLQNENFPRSVLRCVREVDRLLHDMRWRFSLRGGAAAQAVVDEVHSVLTGVAIEKIPPGGLHDFLDWVQSRLSDASDEIGRSYFGTDPPRRPAVKVPVD